MRNATTSVNFKAKMNTTYFFFQSPPWLTSSLSGEQSKSSNALTGSVPSVQVSLIPNIVTERLPGLDRKSKRGVKKGEIKWARRLFCSVLSICRRFPAYLACCLISAGSTAQAAAEWSGKGTRSKNASTAARQSLGNPTYRKTKRVMKAKNRLGRENTERND